MCSMRLPFFYLHVEHEVDLATITQKRWIKARISHELIGTDVRSDSTRSRDMMIGHCVDVSSHSCSVCSSS